MTTYRHTLGTNKRFHRVHIPRTAGRFFHENIQLNKFRAEQESTYVFKEGHEVAHFHREMYKKYLDVEGIPSFAIIRNPVDRFISSSMFLKCFHKNFLDGQSDLQKQMESDEFFDILDNIHHYNTEMINWFRPQVEFLDRDTNVWKLEWGLDTKFGEWIADILELPMFPIHKVSYVKTEFIPEDDKLEPTPKLIDNIRKYYADSDFKFLYPDQ